ncbi:transporter [Cohnella zeiphila]|uniref:Transporter n=1 Tax=Cohnella zeiphila TaxID=2761120 RepID=A0A7X0SKT7_9BACL|nr:transporter [Cohnella zeiphila]MBB6731833.1 transporter [Cohnella zeiphila]
MAFMPPMGPQGSLQAPTAPPPQFVPQQPPQTFAVDPGAIAGCLFRQTYVWLRNGNSFWFYPVFVGRTSVAGFRWNGRFWFYTGIDLRQIVSFTCF